MIKVSIITAIYNVESYLEKCLDSLLNQTLQEIEIIAVNDGSTDSSQAILDKYAKKSDKIKIYQKENGGLSSARNYGFEFATGEYIGYLDSDDYVDSNMYEVMYKKAKEKNADVVECNLHHDFPDGTIDTEIVEKYYNKSDLICFGRHIVWNKIYKHQWLKNTNIIFPNGLIYEDVEFFTNLVPYVNSYDYVDIAPIYYVQRESSINHYANEKTKQIFKILENIRSFYEDRNFEKEYHFELEYLFSKIILRSSFLRMSKIEDKELRKKALTENYEFLLGNYPNWRKNPVLKKQNSKNDMFMKTVTKATYNAYSALLPNIIK